MLFVLIVIDPSDGEGYTFGGLYRSEGAAHEAFVENYGDDDSVTEHIHQASPSDD